MDLSVLFGYNFFSFCLFASEARREHTFQVPMNICEKHTRPTVAAIDGRKSPPTTARLTDIWCPPSELRQNGATVIRLA